MRQTHSLGIPYYVNQAEFQRHPIWDSIPAERKSEPRAGKYSQPLRKFESTIDNNYVVTLREEVSAGRVSE
jgi:DnaJ family protein B protein 12